VTASNGEGCPSG